MFYDNLLELCRRDETTPTFVVKQLKLSTSLPAAWKRGAAPSASTLQKLADYFHVTTDQLLGDLPDPKLTPSEPGVKIPVLSNVGAGIPESVIYTFDQSDPDSWEEISERMSHNGQHFALRIHGDSMEPRICHGDVVIVRIMDHYEDGDYVIALIHNQETGNAEGLCKKLKYKSDGIQLISLNPDYSPLFFTQQECREGKCKIVGKCVEFRGKL